MEGRFTVHPDAIDLHADLPPVEPGRVVALGAICDFRPQRSQQGDDKSFSVSEFVTLEDGRRVTLHQARGFTIGTRSTTRPGAIPARASLEAMTEDVLNVALPDPENGEEHPWEWLADLARARGLGVTAEDLRRLPYEVVFTDAVRRWLASG